AIALTLSSLGAGLAFGQRERAHVRDWATGTAVVRLGAAERRALASLDAVRAAQQRYRVQDWDRDGVADYAESLAELRAAARGRQAETEALVDTSWEAWFTAEWRSRPPTPLGPAGYRVTLRLRYPGLGAQPGWVAGDQGPIEPLGPADGSAP
ncbi:MAG: hypothetical protein KDD82_31295, partial [Planctomycetes bacterium]|nr:hypothetical protein [Planctomycetota bacterium]